MFPFRSKAPLLLWIICVIYVLYWSCFPVCSLLPCSHLLEKGWPLVPLLWCWIVCLSLSHVVFWVRFGTWLYQFLIFDTFLSLKHSHTRNFGNIVTLFSGVCPVGSYWNDVTVKCEPCPLGRYQDEIAMLECEPCEGNKTTKLVGANRSDDCVCKYMINNNTDMRNVCVAQCLS